MAVIFITGIDTEVGKTMITGLLGRYLYQKGESVITQKIAQTGCVDQSEDVLKHREIMGMPYNEDDESGLTCPYIFKFPASPHLAADLESKVIDPSKITQSTNKLGEKYKHVIVEGVGGIHVPLNHEVSLLDYLEEQKYPLIIVSSSKLGSINHTLLTLEVAHNRGLEVRGIIYNHYPSENPQILNDSKKVFQQYLVKYGYQPCVVDVPVFEIGSFPEIDFLGLI